MARDWSIGERLPEAFSSRQPRTLCRLVFRVQPSDTAPLKSVPKILKNRHRLEPCPRHSHFPADRLTSRPTCGRFSNCPTGLACSKRAPRESQTTHAQRRCHSDSLPQFGGFSHGFRGKAGRRDLERLRGRVASVGAGSDSVAPRLAPSGQSSRTDRWSVDRRSDRLRRPAGVRLDRSPTRCRFVRDFRNS